MLLLLLSSLLLLPRTVVMLLIIRYNDYMQYNKKKIQVFGVNMTFISSREVKNYIIAHFVLDQNNEISYTSPNPSFAYKSVV